MDVDQAHEALVLFERGRLDADRRSVLTKLAAMRLDRLARRKKQFADILRREMQCE
jgi:hypothetical protein